VRVLGMDHTALLVGDVEASRRFYGDVLGMEEVPRPANFEFPGAWFRAGAAELHLIGEAERGRVREIHAAYDPEELAAGYCSHFALEVEDLEESRRWVEQRGATIVGGPRRRDGGVAQMYLADPDGYVVELMAKSPVGDEEIPVRAGFSRGDRGRAGATGGPA
jgi:catechol 2,3-dioxygenase-like lactoylglutathione lyase family enzyme